MFRIPTGKIMKINPDLHIPGVNGIKNGSADKKAQGAGAFSKLLDQMSETGASRQTNDTAPVFNTPFVQNPVQSSAQSDALAAGSEAIQLIEHLSVMLTQNSDPAYNLQPMAAALKDEVSALTELRDALPAEDPLRGAIDEISALSMVASMKIERGDFSP